MLWSDLNFVEVGLVAHAYRGGGEPDKAAPPGGETQQPLEHLRGEHLEQDYVNNLPVEES